MNDSFTVREVAERLAVGVRSVKHWIQSGQLAAIDISRSSSPQRRRLRVLAEDLEEFLNRRRTTATQETLPTPRRRQNGKVTKPRKWV